MSGGCLTDDTLAQLLEGRLPPPQTVAVHQHLAGCADCLALVGALGASADLAPGTGTTGLPRAAQTWDRLPLQGAGPPLPESFAEFRLQRLLGKGAMGVVYLAQDTVLSRSVAIKFIQTLNTRGSARFQKEARAIARLTHPNVVTLYRVGEAMGVPYQVSEYIEGQTLAELPLPLPPAEALSIARELSAGLAAAHAQGVVHRDIKPHNIMRTPARASRGSSRSGR